MLYTKNNLLKSVEARWKCCRAGRTAYWQFSVLRVVFYHCFIDLSASPLVYATCLLPRFPTLTQPAVCVQPSSTFLSHSAKNDYVRKYNTTYSSLAKFSYKAEFRNNFYIKVKGILILYKFLVKTLTSTLGLLLRHLRGETCTHPHLTLVFSGVQDGCSSGLFLRVVFPWLTWLRLCLQFSVGYAAQKTRLRSNCVKVKKKR
jgi:hypothetical protein